MDALVQAVVQDVPEAPLMSVRDAIQWAAFRMCQDGNAWIIDDVLVTGSGSILAPEGVYPVRALAVYRNGRLLDPSSYTQRDPGTLTLNASEADVFTVRVAVKPTAEGELPPALRDQHFETLRHGATHRLLLLPQPWRNAEQSTYHEARFTAGINDAYRLSVYGQQPRARVAPRRFN